MSARKGRVLTWLATLGLLACTVGVWRQPERMWSFTLCALYFFALGFYGIHLQRKHAPRQEKLGIMWGEAR